VQYPADWLVARRVIDATGGGSALFAAMRPIAVRVE